MERPSFPAVRCWSELQGRRWASQIPASLPRYSTCCRLQVFGKTNWRFRSHKRWNRCRIAGRMFILLSTYVGGDQYMIQNLHDIIAILRNVSYLEIFFTMTFTPQWLEIKKTSLLGQQVTDRSDLYWHVFWIKLRALIVFLIDENVFGEVEARVRVI